MKSGRSSGSRRRDRTRAGGNKPRTMAALVAGLIALTPAQIAADHNRSRLPQRRVRTPQRAVQYPDNHPLTRHLLEVGEDFKNNNNDNSEDGGQLHDENEPEDDGDDDENEDVTYQSMNSYTFNEDLSSTDAYADDTEDTSISPAPTTFPTAPPAPVPEPIRVSKDVYLYPMVAFHVGIIR